MLKYYVTHVILIHSYVRIYMHMHMHTERFTCSILILFSLKRNFRMLKDNYHTHNDKTIVKMILAAQFSE